MTIYRDILSVETLFAHRSDPQWAIFDCRFDLKAPAWGFETYQQGHIPGAVYAHLDHDLAAPVVKGITGRHPLPDVETMTARFSAWGIAPDTQVVVYDTTGGAYAARLWWMLRFLGHEAVAVLDGGLQKWQAAGYPTSTGVETRQPAVFQANPQWDMLVDAEGVEQMRENPDYRLIDARAAERYRGEIEPIDPVAGHIPGAVNRFHGSNLAPDGTFLPAETLRQQFIELLNGVPPQQAVVYCGSGVTSCHHLVALERAGLPGAKLYTGSWSEWIAVGKRPVSK